LGNLIRMIWLWSTELWKLTRTYSWFHALDVVIVCPVEMESPSPRFLRFIMMVERKVFRIGENYVTKILCLMASVPIYVWNVINAWRFVRKRSMYQNDLKKSMNYLVL
jgi:hypothetical protein